MDPSTSALGLPGRRPRLGTCRDRGPLPPRDRRRAVRVCGSARWSRAPSRRRGIPDVTDAERAAVGVAPRTGFGILAIAWRAWWAQQDGWRGAWHEYWRKPFVRRLRRWGGRVIRPVKNSVIERTGEAERVIVPRHSRYLEVDLAAGHEVAYKLGGTVHDLTVAATLRASALPSPGVRPSRSSCRSRVAPAGGRERAQPHQHGQGHGARVDATLEELVPAVRSQVQDAVQDTIRRDLGERDWSGYATFMTWGRDARYFGGAPIESVTGWPAGDPRDDIACLSCAYGTRTSPISRHDPCHDRHRPGDVRRSPNRSRCPSRRSRGERGCPGSPDAATVDVRPAHLPARAAARALLELLARAAGASAAARRGRLDGAQRVVPQRGAHQHRRRHAPRRALGDLGGQQHRPGGHRPASACSRRTSRSPPRTTASSRATSRSWTSPRSSRTW